jgi:hypothetical protein
VEDNMEIVEKRKSFKRWKPSLDRSKTVELSSILVKSALGVANHANQVRLFGDIDKFMKKMEEGSEYHVYDMYKTEGIAQRIARSENFGNATLLVICLNAIYMGVKGRL